MNRVWAMPNHETFKIKPIKQLLDKFVGNGIRWVDPFAGRNSPVEFTNDLNPVILATSNEDAKVFCENPVNLLL